MLATVYIYGCDISCILDYSTLLTGAHGGAGAKSAYLGVPEEKGPKSAYFGPGAPSGSVMLGAGGNKIVGGVLGGSDGWCYCI